MKTMKLMSMIMCVMAFTSPAFTRGRTVPGQPVIQLAILLDTSNSMDGLIDQAKSQLWKIVAETGKARRNGMLPRLEVALYEYGNSRLSSSGGYIRQVVPFTRDLDVLSQHLFELTTNGGSEHCGQVIQKAVNHPGWRNTPDSLKLIYIAGNEPFTQGPVNYVNAGQNAQNRGITVNTIFCGDYREGVNTYWQHGAHITGGSYININSDYVFSYIQAPQDDRIEELNRHLNDTYIGYGARGQEKKKLQAEQDTNACSLNRSSFLERAKVKSSENYSNAQWDLVDACEEGEINMKNLDEKELPEVMQGMNEREREVYVQQKLKERREIQAEIQRLSTERDEYIRNKKMEGTQESTLDTAILNAMKDTAAKKGFVFEE